MFKLIIIVIVALYVIRIIYRVIQQTTPENVEPIELKACTYCGALVRVDKAVMIKEHIFCNQDHAKKFL